MMPKMIEHRLSLRSTYDHPDIVIPLNENMDFGVDAFFDYLERAVAGGVVYGAEQTIQLGWNLLKLQRMGESDHLLITEPVPDAMPVRWVPGANDTFRQLILQREVCTLVGVEPAFPSIFQAGVVPKEFPGILKRFQMSRDPAEGRDSGWLFNDIDAPGVEGRLASLFEIAMHLPMIKPFVALPAGATVDFVTSDVVVACDGTSVRASSHDLLRQICKSYLDCLPVSD